MKFKNCIIILALAGLGLAACNKGGNSGAAAIPTVPVNPATANLQPPFPMDSTKMKTFPSGLKMQIIQEGIGEFPKPGQKVYAKYHGMLANDTVFDSSYLRGQDFSFNIGQGQVIRAWDEGFSKMKIGTKAILVCPPEIAYGPQGQGKIPPNSTLYFHVELVNIQ